MSKKIIIGISGASGSIYGIKALEIAKEFGIETHLIISKSSEVTLKSEGLPNGTQIAKLASYHYKIGDIGASIASGSFKTDGMIIAPCSVKTMSEIANGITGNLLSRAADVQLKERRRLVLMVRETPFHYGHLNTMLNLTQMGAIIFPPVPAFYTNPHSIDDIVTQSVCRAFDLIGIDLPITKRWDKNN